MGCGDVIVSGPGGGLDQGGGLLHQVATGPLFRVGNQANAVNFVSKFFQSAPKIPYCLRGPARGTQLPLASAIQVEWRRTPQVHESPAGESPDPESRPRPDPLQPCRLQTAV